MTFDELVRVRVINTQSKLSITTHIKPEYMGGDIYGNLLKGASDGERYAIKKLSRLRVALQGTELNIIPEDAYHFKFPKDGFRVTATNQAQCIGKIVVVPSIGWPIQYKGSQFYKVVGWQVGGGAILYPLTDDIVIQYTLTKRAFVLNEPPTEIPHCSWAWAKWCSVIAKCAVLADDNMGYIYPPIPLFRFREHHEN